MSDQELERQFSAFQTGNREAMDFFYKRYHDRIFSFLWRLTKDEAAAEDLLGETFFILMEKHSRIVNVPHLIGFLYLTASNLYRQWVRKRRHALASEKEWARMSQTEADHVADHSEFILDVLELLSPRRKEVIEMKFLRQLEVKEIASLLDIDEQTVRNTINQALKFLRKKLKDPRTEKFLRFY